MDFVRSMFGSSQKDLGNRDVDNAPGQSSMDSEALATEGGDDEQARRESKASPAAPSNVGLQKDVNPPDPEPDGGEIGTATTNHQGPTQRDMGANASHEEINAALHASATELRRPVNTRQSTGKLKSVSKNPPYRNPTGKGPAAQRRLPQISKPRSDLFDPAGSPGRLLRPSSRQTQQPIAISPTRKQRAAKQVRDVQYKAAAPGESRQAPADEPSKPQRSQPKRAARAPSPTVDIDVAPAPQGVPQKRGQPRKSAVPAAEVNADAEQPQEQATPRRSKRIAKVPQAVEDRRADTNDGNANAPQRRKQSSTRAQRAFNAQQLEKDDGSAAEVEIDDQEDSEDGSEKVGNAAVGDDSDGDVYSLPSDDEEVDEDEPLQDSQIVKRVRNSELYPNDDDDDDDNGDDDNDQTQHGDEHVPRQASRKRGRSETANVSRKRQRFISQSAQEEPGLSNADEPVVVGNFQRLYGQWLTLQNVFKAPQAIGVQVIDGETQPRHSVVNADSNVKTVVKLCKKFCRKLGTLKERNEARGAASDLSSDLEEIGSEVDDLHVSRGDNVVDFRDREKCTEIYFFVFPQLVKTLQALIAYYEAIDGDPNGHTPIRGQSLSVVKDVIDLILDLGRGAHNYHPRPDPSYRAVQPVDNGIIAPLKTVRNAFTRTLGLLSQKASATQYEQREERARPERERREREKQRCREYLKNRRAKWNHLHTVRLHAEGNFPSVQKREHLAPVEPVQEYDQDGMPFERLEVFAPRIGPPPALVHEARITPWSGAELHALLEGLENHSGADVFEEVFLAHCGRYRTLNKYNVTEIVTTAADLRAWLIEERQRQGRDVEKWVDAIPVWTTTSASGGENAGEDPTGLGNGVEI